MNFARFVHWKGSRWILCSLGLLYCAGYCVAHYGSEAFGLDFEPYYLQAKALVSGSPEPYDVHGTKLGWNLPTTLPLTYATLLVPLVWIPLQGAQLIHVCLNVVFLIIALWSLAKCFDLDELRTCCLVGMATVLYPTVHCLAVGQVAIILLMLTSLSLLYYREQRWILSALMLGLAASIKITPIFLLAVFFLHRRYWYVVVGMTSFILFQVVPGILWGWEAVWEYWSKIFPALNASVSPFIFNQSIVGYLHRWAEYRHTQWPLLNQIVPAVLLGGFLLKLSWKQFTSRQHGPDSTCNREIFSDVAVLAVLIALSTPIGWAHHFVAVILLLGCILALADDRRLTRSNLLAMAVGVLLLSIPLEVIDFRPQDFLSVMMSAPILFGAVFLLSVFWLMRLKGQET